jgi:acyl carrier protein
MTGYDEALTKLSALLENRLELAAGTRLDPDLEIDEAGIDSVDLAFVFAHWERTTGAIFEDDEFDVRRYKTVGNLAAALAAKASSVITRPATVQEDAVQTA